MCAVCTWEIKHMILRAAEGSIYSPENQQLSQRYRSQLWKIISEAHKEAGGATCSVELVTIVRLSTDCVECGGFKYNFDIK